VSSALTKKVEGKIGILLLSGFLGAGKTTLLKRILGWETDLSGTVVLVNEFGDIGIDGSLLKDSGTDVIELTSGCICCTLSADLKRSLTTIRERFNPRRIFIEGSGVADPTSIEAVINKTEIGRFMALTKIITVLDADFWEARETFGPLFYNQLQMAHLILLNKIDLLENEKVARFLSEIHKIIPDSQVVPTIQCAIDPETLWSEVKPTSFGLKPIHFYRPVSLHQPSHFDDHPHPVQTNVDSSKYVTFSFQHTRHLDETCFKQFIGELPWAVFRIKGPVLFADRLAMLNFVGGKSEWLPWEGTPETRLAFIGWDVSPAEILQKLKGCLSDS
jgi:G3E family GTPase